jgi:hypothetical protein
VLEFLGRIERTVLLFTGDAAPPQGPSQYLVDKHFLRKHGKDAYYGQK